MAKRKVKVSEESSELLDAYEAAVGFNYGDERVEAGTLLFEKDFTPELWESMHANKVLKEAV